MATDIRRWIGTSTPGDMSVAANWDDGNGGAGGVPTADDDVFFTTGSEDVDVALATLNGIVLRKVIITAGYSGDIGLAGTFCDLEAEYMYIEGAGGTSHYIDVVTSGGGLIVHSTGALLEMSGTIPIMTLDGGTITLDGVTCATSMVIGTGAPNVTIDSDCTINAAGIVMSGGRVLCSAVHGGMSVRNGVWEQLDGNGGTVDIFGGIYRWEAIGHTLTKARVYGGYLDCSGDPGIKTITDIELWSSGQINLDNGCTTIVVTNGIELKGAGNITLPAGTLVTLSLP